MNSSASCTIVCLLCLFTAFLTGTFGVLQKQITACMVTGVMYMLSGKSQAQKHILVFFRNEFAKLGIFAKFC